MFETTGVQHPAGTLQAAQITHRVSGELQMGADKNSHLLSRGCSRAFQNSSLLYNMRLPYFYTHLTDKETEILNLGLLLTS